MPRILVIFIIFAIGGAILFGLFKQIAGALQAGTRLDQAVAEVNNLEDENKSLKNKLAQAQSSGFIEEVARDKLNMAKKGETVVVIPDQAIKDVLGASVEAEPAPLPNWQGWIKLFF